jgi:hypothetical protein
VCCLHVRINKPHALPEKHKQALEVDVDEKLLHEFLLLEGWERWLRGISLKLVAGFVLGDNCYRASGGVGEVIVIEKVEFVTKESIPYSGTGWKNRTTILTDKVEDKVSLSTCSQ